MKFTRIYTFSGTKERMDEYDSVSHYLAENGKQIDVVYSLCGNSVCGYDVDGHYFEKLHEAKDYLEEKEAERTGKVESMIATAELSFEISESGMTLEQVIKAVEKKYPAFKFDRTEGRYDTCVMAVFEMR